MEEEMAPQSSTLAWKIPWMEEPGGLQSMGSRRVGHNWATSFTHTSEKIQTPQQTLKDAQSGLGHSSWVLFYIRNIVGRWTSFQAPEDIQVPLPTLGNIDPIWPASYSSVFLTDFFSWSKSHMKCHLFREYTVNINLLHYCPFLHLDVSYLVFITLFIICSSGLWSVFLLSTHTHHGLERAMCPTCCFPFITQHITHTWCMISKPKYSKWMNT